MPQSSSGDAKQPVSRKRGGRTDERIHSEIYAAIINHQLRPATPLHEDALASAFGVSRTIIRKVLQRLSHEKLVELIPNKGAIVARPSVEEARQVFQARRMVECMLVSRLAPNITERDIERLDRVVSAEATSQEQGDKRGRLQLSGDFHRELASIAGNDVLRDFVHELISRSSLIIALYESPGAVPCSYDEHKQIVDALRLRDPDIVSERMERHLRHIEAQIDLSDVPARVDFKSLFKALT
jgi:DNA-binding GntR family transcriptional regulator